MNDIRKDAWQHPDHVETDWQEMCERYPLSGVLGPQEDISITPVQPLDRFEKVMIVLIVASLIVVLFTHS